MTRNARSYAKLSLFAVLCSLTLIPARAAAQVEHLGWAQELIDNVSPTFNSYATGPYYIKWAGVNGAVQYENHTLCSNFLTALLQQAYGITSTQMRAWMGSTSPNAAMYHDKIVAQQGFIRITNIADIQPGDVLTFKYEAGNSASGHLAIAEEAPTLRFSTSPHVSGTQQYEIWVIDSTKQGHGAADNRLKSDGTWIQGAGRGAMRLYADSTGEIVGYTWSLSHYSVYYDVSVRSVAVGRLP